MRKFVIVFGVLIAALATSIGISLAPTTKKKTQHTTLNNEQQAADLSRAAELLNIHKPDESLEIVHHYKQEIEKSSDTGQLWLDLFIRGSEETRDIPQLTVLFEFQPESFKDHESASLLVADSYINDNRTKDYKKIRSLWEDRETQVAAWYVLDVDQLLLEGRREDAILLLKSRTFKDKADIGRLVRLALLYADEDPKISWKYLGEAYSKDPQNADVRSYRAKLLETAGKYNLAHNEYQAAIRLDPNNIFLKDQLADYYLRQKQYPMALKTWSETLSPPSLDKIWVKSLFWGKLTTPVEFEWSETPPPQGILEPFVQYLVSLDNRAFWSDEKFERVPNNSYYLRTQQATFWLQLLNALKNKNEKEAYKLLKYNTFMTTSWDPELELALKRVLAYRMNKTLKVDDSLIPIATIQQEKSKNLKLPPLFQQLETLAANENSGNSENIPRDLQNLLLSNEIFSAIFLTAEWYEAGLQLHQLPVIPEDFPAWVAPNLTKAIHHNRSSLEALEFASSQNPSPELSLLIAELMIAGGNTEAALETLNKLTKLDSDVGFRSAWLASLLYIEKKEWKAARNTIISQPKLVNDLLGRETLARIAYLEGDTTLADKLYATIEKTSPEARSYLAKKAYSEKNWKRARELTEKLITDYPDNPMLRKNLEKILEEQQKTRKNK